MILQTNISISQLDLLSFLWHCFLSHVRLPTLMMLQFEDVPTFKAKYILYQYYPEEKQTYKQISKDSTTRLEEILELNYTNPCGPLLVISLLDTRSFC